MRILAALLVLLIAWRTEAQMVLPEVPHYELQAGPDIATEPHYTQPGDPGKTKGAPENNKGQNPKSFRQRLAVTFDRILDDPVAFITLCLVAIAGLQAFLFVWQLILIKLSLNDAKMAAQAAGDSARGTLETVRVLRNAQRPYLSPFDPELRNFDKAVRNNDWSQVISVQLDITNIGRGVGFIRSYAIAHEICQRDRQGEITLRVNDYIARLPLHTDGKWAVENATFHNFQIRNDADREAILDASKFLYIYGYVRYSDLFAITRRTGFMFQYIPNRETPENGVLVMCPHAMWYDIEEEREGG